jgi:hypothetical protein
VSLPVVVLQERVISQAVRYNYNTVKFRSRSILLFHPLPSVVFIKLDFLKKNYRVACFCILFSTRVVSS